MNLQLEAMALAMPEVAGHPNRLPFRGVLTLVGVASQRAPQGAKGHRVMMTRAAADAALPSLLGMALDYAPSLDSHDVRRKIGIITEANIVPLHPTLLPGAPPSLPAVDSRVEPGRTTGQLAVSGYLFAKDFPEVVDEIRAQSSAAGSTLGMSYEVTSVDVPNLSSSIWTVTAFTFTGAAVLRRDKAAYPQTWIALENGGRVGQDKAGGYG
ncbi:MAG: hypothetical protein ACLPND_21160 [Candidatus Korobacteraceae bacterium]